MKQFGTSEPMQPACGKSERPVWNQQLLSKELLIWLICLTAASIGPGLLINAEYTLFFTVAPLVFLFVCSILYHGIVQRVQNSALYGIILMLLYGVFTWDMIQHHSWKAYIGEMVTVQLGGEGLATLSILHLLWIVVLLRFLHKGWRGAARSSYEYWTMVILAVFLVRTELITDSSEGKVLLLNTFLLYSFFQQMIGADVGLQIKNKMSRY